jgi:hypothetical protein
MSAETERSGRHVKKESIERMSESAYVMPSLRPTVRAELARTYRTLSSDRFTLTPPHLPDHNPLTSAPQQLQRNGGISSILSAVRLGRPTTTDIIPGTVLRHFLYKSRGNVQFFSPSFAPHFSTPVARRRLLNLYARLHSHLHGKPASLKIHYEMSVSVISLAWSTPLFEMYAVADGRTTRQALARAAERVVGWVRREEERVFIIGGAVF